MDRPRPWLRYVEAADLADPDVDFDGLPVGNRAGEKLGEIEGFIMDADTARPYHVVVDAGGWFKSKHYLLPVGHVRFDPARQVFTASLPKERIKRFPGFDLDKFDKLSDEELVQLDLHIAAVCCPGDAVAVPSATWGDRWAHYEEPDWWESNYYRPDHAGSRGV